MGKGMYTGIIAIGISYIPMTCKMARSLIMTEKKAVYVEACRSMGMSDARIIFVHILPNVITTMISQFTLDIVSAITAMATLSFLGLGVQAPDADWGTLLKDGMGNIYNNASLLVIPAICIITVTVSINLFSDGIQKLLIADEPTTALDVTIQAQILHLIKELQRETGMSVIIITHNLGVVAEICDSVTVMYAGKVVESGNVGDIFDHPSHPYTKALLESNPKESDTEKRMKSIAGSPPLLYEKFKACPFEPRCSYSCEKCRNGVPVTETVGEGHTAACFKWQEVAQNV